MAAALLFRLAFLMHAVIETPAAVVFLCAPQRQVPAAAAPAVRLALQNLGGLLAASVLASAVLAARGHLLDPTTRGLLALAMASYHIFPCRRAYRRRGEQDLTLGGPAVHLAVHVACLVVLTAAGLAEVK